MAALSVEAVTQASGTGGPEEAEAELGEAKMLTPKAAWARSPRKEATAVLLTDLGITAQVAAAEQTTVQEEGELAAPEHKVQ